MRILDLFCGAGGAAAGYVAAGHSVVGIDIHPQPCYPYEFYQYDALTVLRTQIQGALLWGPFDAIHASPPCQAYTSIRRLGKRAGENAVDLISMVRTLLIATGLPYVIENVPGAPLLNPIQLCGSSFGLGVRRHRLFESNVRLSGSVCRHTEQGRSIAVYGDHPQDPGRGTVNRARTLLEGQKAMGIDWMPWKSLTQAIPPAYTHWIGEQLHEQQQRRLRAEEEDRL